MEGESVRRDGNPYLELILVSHMNPGFMNVETNTDVQSSRDQPCPCNVVIK